MKVGILIPKRPEYGNAYWCLQRKFESGLHVVEVDERQLSELRADSVVQVVDAAELESATAASDEKPSDEKPSPGKPMKR
jgi:hypothetical protein